MAERPQTGFDPQEEKGRSRRIGETSAAIRVRTTQLWNLRLTDAGNAVALAKEWSLNFGIFRSSVNGNCPNESRRAPSASPIAELVGSH